MATLEQIAAALQKADAAGNVEDARALANAYRQMQQQGQSAPVNADPGFNPMSDLPIPGTSHPTAPDNRYKPMIPGGAMLNEFAQSFGENIPVVGPLATRAADATGAQIASMITGKPAEEMAIQGQEMRARDASDNQVANVAGTVAGTVGPLMSLGTTKFGEQALGITGPMWQRMFAGSTSGGLIAGADSAARGESTNQEVLGQTGLGAGLGAAFPLAERAASPFIRMLTGQNVSKATQGVNRNLERARIEPTDLPRLMDDLGPDAMMLDLNKNLTRQGGGVASVPGQGGTILDDALTARHQGTNSRIIADVDSTLGPAPIPSRLAAEIDTNRKALSPYYDQVLDGARAVETDGIALNLDSMIVNERGAAQAAARQVRQMLNVTGESVLDPNPRTLLNTRHAIDGILYTDGALAPLDSNVKRVLQQARRDIDAELAAKVPGIKEVDARYSELAGQGKAVTDGQTLLDSGRAQVTRPAELDDMLAPEMSIVGPSGVPFRLSQGTRAEIDRLIGTTGNDITALKGALKGDESWNRQKLASLYGEDKADRLIWLLEREQRYTDSFNRITQNSETAARTAAQKEAAPHQFGQTSTSLADLALKIPQGLANMGARARSEATNKAIAEMLTGKITPELVDQLLSARQMNRGLMGSSAVPLLTN